MSLDDHIDVTLTINNSGLTQLSFGQQAMITYRQIFAERSRSYARRQEMIDDGYAADSPEVRFLSAALGGTARSPNVKLLRGTRPPTARYLVLATAAVGASYVLTVDGEGVTSTDVSLISDSNSTLAGIHSALVTELNAVVGANYTAALALSTFTDFTFTADSSTDQLHAVAHGRTTGEGPARVSNSGGALPAPLSNVADYYFIRVDADNFKLATSRNNAILGVPVDLTTNGTGVQTALHQAGTANPALAFTVTANAAGNFFTLASNNTRILALTQNHADPGVAADLDDIFAEDPDWYYLHTWGNSELLVKAAAAWAEPQPFKVYVGELVDSASENSTVGSGDAGDDIALLKYSRVLMTYRRKPIEMWSAAIIGRMAPKNVGTWTLAYKEASGTTSDKFTTQQKTNLHNKKMTYYKSEAGRNMAWEGQLGSDEFSFLDVRVSLDFMLDLIQKRAFGLLKALDKLAYVDEDIVMMAGTIQGAIDEGASDAHKIVARGTPGDPNDPQPFVRFPRVRDIDSGARSLRNIPNGEVFFRLQGAVHSVSIGLTVTF